MAPPDDAARARAATSSSASAPDAHDPTTRTLVHVAGEWELRVGAVDRLLQVWSPRARISVIRFPEAIAERQAAHAGGWVVFPSTEAIIRQLVLQDFGLVLPCSARLDAIERWFLRRRVASELCELAACPGV